MPLSITIICVGKLKERFYAEAADEFLKRLSRYTKVDIAELPDEKAPETLSEAAREQVKNAEGKRILSRLKDVDMLIALDMRGKVMSSEGFAQLLDEQMTRGRSHICFAVGGSLGHSAKVLTRADMVLSFGEMTFSHQLFRIMLLEQIYRAFRIINGEPYHK